MKRHTKILVIGGVILFGQLIIFRDYLFPFHWGQIKITGEACTCPDDKVINGQLYLRAITPDSLKKYNLDYSEIFVTEQPSTDIYPMGVDCYIIKGQVIGKARVDESSPWNPKVRIDSWREVDIIIDWIVKVLFFVQLLILFFLLKKRK